MGYVFRTGRGRDRPDSGRCPRRPTELAITFRPFSGNCGRGDRGIPAGSRPGPRKAGPTPWTHERPSLSSSVALSGRPARDIGPIEFPAHEQVQRPGWDGIVEAGQADDFVPAGTSGWEMGVEKNPQKKAEEDFAKRAKDPHGLDRAKTTFVFVTPRKWQKKAEVAPG